MIGEGFFSGFIFISFLLIAHSCSNKSENFTYSPDNVQISYNTQGKGQPTLVFIHGWSNSKIMWDSQVSHFSNKYKVVTIDLAGHGMSGDNRDKWTMSAFADDVVAVINKLKLDDVVLVGLSMGSPVIIETAKKKPQLITGLVLVDYLKDIEIKYPPEIVKGRYNAFMDIIKNLTPEKLEGFLLKRNPKGSFERVQKMLENPSQNGWKESFYDLYRWRNEDCVESLKKIRIPIIAINSDATPTNVEALRKYVPSFEVKVIKDVGHLINWDAPNEFNRLLEESIQKFK
jgi:pimeloyl-ACP methyl ester carboxylesterase